MMKASTADPKANSLLDFIAIKESNGNYNIMIGGDAVDDFSTYSIGDVYDLQQQLLSQGKPSSAVGRYQFVRATLEAMVKQAGLSVDDKFTPEVQDHLAYIDLVNHGYKLWLAGSKSDEDFAHSLSCEWASLPDPQNGGKSHYDGVGPNHAGQTLEAVYAALAASRAA
jgi:conjugal transfer mating pair stabilization protein TraG